MDIIKLLEYIGDNLSNPYPLDVPVLINDREYRAYQIKPGADIHKQYDKNAPKEPGVEKVTSYEVDLERKAAKVKDLRTFRSFMATAGVARALRILERAEDDDEYLKLFMMLAPYALPKLNAVDYKAGEGKIIDITELQETHTVTIRDMRTNTQKVISDK